MSDNSVDTDGSDRDPPETLNIPRYPSLSIPNIEYFEIPADNIGREKKFYSTLLGWKIEPATNLDPASAAALQYHSISTGPAENCTMNAGGMYSLKNPGGSSPCSRSLATGSSLTR